MAGVGEADRERVVKALERAAAGGRLNPGELADRVHRARTLTTHAGLDGLLHDLPPEAPAPWAVPGVDQPAPTTAPAPARAPAPAPAPSGFPPPPAPWPRRERGSRHRIAATMALTAGAICLWLAAGRMDNVPRSPTPAYVGTTTSTAVPSLPPTTDRVVPRPAVGAVDPILLVVGDGAREIDPGLYTHATEGDCLWERRDYFGQRVIESRTAPRLVVEMGPNEQLFSLGCGPWHLYAAPEEPATTFGDGDWLVGADVWAAVYRSSGAVGDASRCRWEVSNGFGQFAQPVDHGFSLGPTEAALPRNHRFTSTGCGPWTLVE